VFGSVFFEDMLPRVRVAPHSFQKWSFSTGGSDTAFAFSSRLEVVPEEQWRSEAEAYKSRVRRLVGGNLTSYDSSNPIYNFLFRYYFWKPSSVATFSPGWNRILLGANPCDVTHGGGQRAPFNWRDRGLYFDGSCCRRETLEGFEKTLDLLRKTESRPPTLSCFGMHEWAMLYSPPSVEVTASVPSRHQGLPLRLSQELLNSVVEERAPLRCSHFDAYRFFAQEAVGCINCLYCSSLTFLICLFLGWSRSH
jgi:hypothetical protein